MGLDEEVAEKFKELEKKYVGNRRLALYGEVHAGISSLKNAYEGLSESINRTLQTIKDKKFAALSDILLKNLQIWRGYAFFLFDDVFDDFVSKSKEIDKYAGIYAGISKKFTKNRINSIVNQLICINRQNGNTFEFKGATTYIDTKNGEYCMIYYMLSRNVS